MKYLTKPNKSEQFLAMIPREVLDFIHEIEKAGYEIVVIGGAVRDFWLNRPITDFDLATSATPQELMSIRKDHRWIDMGSRFGGLIRVLNETSIEVTTFRKDFEYRDHRKPNRVVFTRSLEEDLVRRDFTINAMGYRVGYGFFDPLNGQNDICEKTIRAIGDPDERLREDMIRALRAIRFAAVLDFEVEPELFQAIRKRAMDLAFISAERIRNELDQILLSDHPDKGLDLLSASGLLEQVLPEIQEMVGFEQDSPFHLYDLFEHTKRVVSQSYPKLEIRWAALLHDVGKRSTKTIDEAGIAHYYQHAQVGVDESIGILKRFRMSNRFIQEVTLLIGNHMNCKDTYTKKSIKRLLKKMGPGQIEDLFYLQEADIRSTTGNTTENIVNGRELLEELKNEKGDIEPLKLKINGYDIIELGVLPSPKIGEILEAAEELVLEHEEYNDRDYLIEWVKNYKREGE